MLAYWLLFSLFALGALVANGRSVRWRLAPVRASQENPNLPRDMRCSPEGGRWLGAAATVAAIMIGMRYEVGADWPSYQEIFELVAKLGFWRSIQTWEPAYVALNLLAYKLGAEIWFVNFVCAALFMFGLLQFAKWQPNAWLTIVLALPFLVIGVAMGYTRQAAAIGCGLAGLAALTRGSFARFVLWVLLGALFHRSAVILLPIVTLSYSRNRLQTVAIATVGLVLAYYFVRTGLARYERMYLRNFEAAGAGIRLAMNLPPAFFFLAMPQIFTNDTVLRSVWRNMAVIAIGCFVAWIFTDATVAIDRLAVYIIPLQLFVLSRLPAVIGGEGRPARWITVTLIIYSAAVLFVWLFFAKNADHWLPYRVYPLW